ERGGRTQVAVLLPPPFRGWQTPPACYPRLCDVGYYLSPFGLCAPSRLRLAAMWGSLVSCGRLVIGQLPRLHGRAAVDNRLAGCQPAPHHASNATFMSRTPESRTFRPIDSSILAALCMSCSADSFRSASTFPESLSWAAPGKP